MQGLWVDAEDGRSVELIFSGGHVISAGTTFRATWATPFTTKNERPTFEYSYDLESQNELGRQIDTVQAFRFRYRNERWSSWITHRHRLKPGSTYIVGASLFQGWAKRQVEFEFRWTGRILAPTRLHGSASFSIN